MRVKSLSHYKWRYKYHIVFAPNAFGKGITFESETGVIVSSVEGKVTELFQQNIQSVLQQIKVERDWHV